MEDKIFVIVTDLIRDEISKNEAIDKLLSLYSVSKCAHDFIDIDYKIKQCVKCKEYLDLLD